MVITYKQPDGSEEAINVPMHPREISFSRFCDFRNARATFEDAELDPQEYAAQLTAGLNHLVPGIRVAGIPFTLDEDWDKDLVDGGYFIKVGDQLSILRIYAHIVNVVNSYQPEEVPDIFRFTHQGQDFEIQRRRAADAMLGRTTGEMIETLEYQRRATLLMESERKDVGNLDFELGLTELAILVRQPGEELPADKPSRDAFIEKRRRLFASVDLETIIGIRFFFLSSLLASRTTPTTATFGKVLRVATPGGEHKTSWRLRLLGKKRSSN